MAGIHARTTWCYTINNYDEESGIDPTLCTYVIEAHEMGENGVPHIQGYCILKERKRRNQVSLELPGAHLEPAKGTPWQNFIYCAKGEQSKAEFDAEKDAGPNWGRNAIFLEWGERPKAPGPSHKKKPADTTYAEALAATTVQEAMEIIKKRKPRDACLHGEAIERNIKRFKTSSKNHNSRYLDSDFLEPVKQFDGKCLLFCGPTGIGKTQFALAHFKNPCLVRELNCLKAFGPDNDGIVFDDMSFTHWSVPGVIHLLDNDCDSTFRVMYGTVTIPANTRRIFTYNLPNPFYNEQLVPQEQATAIDRRFQRYNFYAPLFTRQVQRSQCDNRLSQGEQLSQQLQLSVLQRDTSSESPMVLVDEDPSPVDDYTNTMNQVD